MNQVIKQKCTCFDHRTCQNSTTTIEFQRSKNSKFAFLHASLPLTFCCLLIWLKMAAFQETKCWFLLQCSWSANHFLIS